MTRQISFFDGKEDFKIRKPVRLIELFAGYGSQSKALEELKKWGMEFEHWKICEWAVKSIQAYKDIHFPNDNTDYSKYWTDEHIVDCLNKWQISSNYNEPMTLEQIKRLGSEKQREIFNNICATHNPVNIQQVKGRDLQIVDTDKYCYVMTYSFPCQDLSSAGLGKGMERGSGTRSGMLWEVERILDECYEKPQVLLMENVPEVIGSNAIKDFAEWLAKLESWGYKCYWHIENAKDYGIPQNRERCFMVSILGDYFYEFPKKIKLEHKLKDLLEENVDEKFYLSDKMKKYIKAENGKWTGNDYKSIINRDIGVTINTRVGNTRADCSDYICDELPANYNLKTKLCNDLIANGKVKEGDIIRHSYTNSRFDDFHIENEENHDCCSTLTTRADCIGVVVKNKYLGTYEYNKSDKFMQGKERLNIGNEITGTIQTTHSDGIAYTNMRIRKLTPKECFRLMGVKDEDFEKVAKNQSNASLYHLAGDSIVVAVLVAIFGQMLDNFDFNEYIEEFYKEIGE